MSLLQKKNNPNECLLQNTDSDKNTGKILKKTIKKFCVDMLNISPKKARNNLNITARARSEKPGPSPNLKQGALVLQNRLAKQPALDVSVQNVHLIGKRLGFTPGRVILGLANYCTIRGFSVKRSA